MFVMGVKFYSSFREYVRDSVIRFIFNFSRNTGIEIHGNNFLVWIKYNSFLFRFFKRHLDGHN